MQIAPVYDRTILAVECGPPVVPAFLRQRRRLLQMLGTFGDEQWAAPSRCEGWRVQDVAAHLQTVDAFWIASLTAGLAGEPTRFLEGFDPKVTPAALVDGAAGKSPARTLADVSEATTALCALVEELDEAALACLAESPPGHVAIRDVLHHALWDAWIHERDIAIPLDLVPVEEPDEVVGSFLYAAALSPMFAVMGQRATDTTLLYETTGPDVRAVVSVTPEAVRVHDGESPHDALILRGDTVELAEMLSTRLPLDLGVPDDRRWLVRSLADVFE